MMQAASGTSYKGILLAGGSGTLHAVASDVPTGFETTIPIRGGFSAVEVEAMGAGRRRLGTSKVLPIST